MEKNIELKKDNIDKLDNEYNTLAIIINQQVMLSQKVSILMTIDYLLIGLIIPIATIFNWYYLFALIYFAIPLLMNIVILYPVFIPKGVEKSKKIKLEKNIQKMNNTNYINDINISEYFYHFKSKTNNDIKESVNSQNNILSQIRINSKILCWKYRLFQISLVLTTIPFSLFALTIRFIWKNYIKSIINFLK